MAGRTGDNKKISDNQEAFIQEYLKDQNGTRAVLRLPQLFKVTTENSAASQASKFLSTSKIVDRIAILRGATLNKSEYGRDNLLEEYKAIAHCNIIDFIENGAQTDDGKTLTMKLIHFRQLPRELTAAVRTIKTKKNGEVEFQLYDKIKAMEGLGKHFGLFEKDNIQKGSLGLDISKLSEKELLVFNKLLIKSQQNGAE